MFVLGGSWAVILHEDGPLTLHPRSPSDPPDRRITSGNGSVITRSSADGSPVSRICGTQRGIDESMDAMDGVFKVVIYDVAYVLIYCKIRYEMLQRFYEGSLKVCVSPRFFILHSLFLKCNKCVYLLLRHHMPDVERFATSYVFTEII
jgi:hypothetical protein